MGVDLKLLPVEHDGWHWGFAHSMLEVGRDYEFHRALEKQHPKPREGFDFTSYVATVPDGKMEGESCYGVVDETPYGKPLTYLSVREILAAYDLYGPNDYTGYRLKAAMAYLRELPPGTPVALYWH